MRLHPDRARRVLQRSRALAADREYRAWLATMTPQHRAIHERGTGWCATCLKATVERMNASIAPDCKAVRVGRLAAGRLKP